MNAITRELFYRRPGPLKQRVDYALSKAYDVGGWAFRQRVMHELQDAGIIRVESKPWVMGNVTVWSVCCKESEHLGGA